MLECRITILWVKSRNTKPFLIGIGLGVKVCTTNTKALNAIHDLKCKINTKYTGYNLTQIT